MITFRRRTWWEKALRLFPSIRAKQDADIEAAIKTLCADPSLPCKIKGEIIPDGYGYLIREALKNNPMKDSQVSNYPPLAKWLNSADHLLFDLGYSYGLLARTEGLLDHMLQNSLCAPDSLTEQAAELLANLQSFRTNRLNNREQIYGAAKVVATRIANQPEPKS